MDCAAVFHSPDSLLLDLGLTAKGDILSLKAFCGRRLSNHSDVANEDERLEEKKLKLVRMLRKEKDSKKKRRRSNSRPTEESEQKQQPPHKVAKTSKSRRISLGWLHYSYKDSRYVAVRLTRGGGTRKVDIDAAASKEEVIARAKKIFFAGGTSSNGSASEMRFDLANFKLENITKLTDEQGNRYPFTVQKYFEVHKLTQARLYLTSRRMSTVSSAQEDSAPDSTLITSGIGHPPAKITSKPSGSPPSTHSPKNEDKGWLWRQTHTIETPQQGGEKTQDGEEKLKNEECLRREVDEVERLEAIRKTRENRIPPEPTEHTHRVKVCVNHCFDGEVSRFFLAKEQMIAVYDWVGSLSLYPECFGLLSSPDKCVEPTELVGVVDGKTLCMEIAGAPIPVSPQETDVTFRGFGFGDYQTDLTCFLPDVITVDDERYFV